ncbi:hypothetical protein V9T40_010890 [Parthenolecanium corni]|uniref:C2H2-type domain-containing protein n=1 Tax=Parthenolecanium corni TaxID=536013 RepID=A0AAN9T7Y7_9HEMI
MSFFGGQLFLCRSIATESRKRADPLLSGDFSIPLSRKLKKVKGRYVCFQCGRLYKHKESVYSHIKYECGIAKQFECYICRKQFSRKNYLKSHLGLVESFIMGQLPFFDPDLLEAVFSCPKNCGRRYRSKYSLKNHLKYECGVERKFKCNDCGRLFTQKGNLKTHVITVHKKIFSEDSFSS